MTSFKDEILEASKSLEISQISDLVLNLIDEIKLVKVEKYDYETMTRLEIDQNPNFAKEISDNTIQKMQSLEMELDKNAEKIKNLRKICEKHNQNIINDELDKIENLLSWNLLMGWRISHFRVSAFLNNSQAKKSDKPENDELNKELKEIKAKAVELKSMTKKHDEILKIIREKVEKMGEI